MEYLDDDEIDTDMAALEHVSDWAQKQMATMRRPKAGAMQPAEEEIEGINEPEAMPEMEQPLDEPPPPAFGAKKPPGMDVEIEVITPGRSMAAHQKPKGESMPPKDDGMRKWTNETIQKLDKFGRKMKQRGR